MLIGVTSMSTVVQELKTSGGTPTRMYLQGFNHFKIQCGGAHDDKMIVLINDNNDDNVSE